MSANIEMKYNNRSGSEWYESKCGMVLQREIYSAMPNGELSNGKWVLRDDMEIVIDFDQFRDEIADRNNLDLCSDGKP